MAKSMARSTVLALFSTPHRPDPLLSLSSGCQPSTLNLEARDGTVIPLQAGMTITTSLKLRDRRLIELLGDLFNDRGESLKHCANHD